ncbi:hypothetical protein [Streptomyces albireticuli]|uniref:Uncharacterized protein n=1 Tax=Streptomyces albireticuli TaxID=1940 RepID=A0A2A2D3R5_9ACTN|nr:hypothetical protein [Streptomyces albireticuli]MCD9196071.1 hypothetical protein [Streptomyces albireticuli]PAU46174.1 hypothetical protein CK936_25605 [Streptomyces albireticuli]
MLITSRMVDGRCPCGAAHAACGPPSTSVPVDDNFQEVAVVGGPLKKYKIRTASGAETVMKYNAADAARYGLTDADLAETPPTPEPEGGAAGKPAGKARTAAANKARTAANKARGH